MGLYIKQHVFTWRDSFSVNDECGNPLYYVKGEFFSLGKRLHIYDTNGNEAAYIEQKLFSLMPCYTAYAASGGSARIRQHFTFFTREYSVEGPGWQVKGDFLQHDYEIFSNGQVIGRVYKKWLSWGDTYMIDYRNVEDELLMLCTVLSVDASIETQN